MSRFFVGVLIGAGIFAGCAVNSKAQLFTSEWKATLRVVDERGQPLSGANVAIGYQIPPGPDESIAVDRKTGTTDTNGIFRASKRSRAFELVFLAQKAGYYESSIRHELGYQYDALKWNPTATLVLKRIVQPISMYAKRVNTAVPAFNKPVGYDLSSGDWVTPYGKGTNADMLFTAHLEKRAENDWDHKLVINFPNQGDGIQPFTMSSADKASKFHSPHEAPLSGYVPTWTKLRNRNPDRAQQYEYDEELKFFFRVRTVSDEKGNIKSAHYGKIYGDFMRFNYYFNPTANSRNIEFDPSKNPLRGPKRKISDVVEP
jgi:hypothetical protein